MSIRQDYLSRRIQWRKPNSCSAARKESAFEVVLLPIQDFFDITDCREIMCKNRVGQCSGIDKPGRNLQNNPVFCLQHSSHPVLQLLTERSIIISTESVTPDSSVKPLPSGPKSLFHALHQPLPYSYTVLPDHICRQQRSVAIHTETVSVIINFLLMSMREVSF